MSNNSLEENLKILEIDPNNKNALKFMVEYYQNKDYKKCLSYVNMLLRRENSLIARKIQCECYYYLEMFKECIKCCSYILSKEPNYVKAIKNLNGCYYKSGNYKMAIKYCKRVLRIEPDDNVSIYICAESYENLGNHVKSLKYYEKYLESDPDNLYVLRLCINNNFKIKDYYTCLCHCNNYLDKQYDLSVQLTRSNCLISLEKYNECIENNRELFKMGFLDKVLYKQNAKCYQCKIKTSKNIDEELENRRLCKENCIKVLEIDPEDVDMICILGSLNVFMFKTK